MIDLRRLRAFVAVAQEGHVTRAAERLGIAQPPLTRLLRGLEHELGVRLLHRHPRGVRPTAAGEALAALAADLLARAETVPDAVRRAARGERGRLAVGFTASAILHPFVPACVSAFRGDWPDVAVTLTEGGTGELVDSLHAGRIDAAFIRSPLGPAPGLVVDPVLTEPMVAAFPAAHSLAHGDAPLPLAGLAGEAFVLYRRQAGPGLHDAILGACRDAGFTPAVAQHAPQLPATLSLVAAGLGVSIVPRSLSRIAVADVAFRALCDCPGLAAPLSLALRIGTDPPTASRFRALVRARAACPAPSPGP